jgi:hypothetical protein
LPEPKSRSYFPIPPALRQCDRQPDRHAGKENDKQDSQYAPIGTHGAPPIRLSRSASWIALAALWQIKQVELAQSLGVSPQLVTEWIKGRKHPTGEQALAMLELIKSKPKAKKRDSRQARTPEERSEAARWARWRAERGC